MSGFTWLCVRPCEVRQLGDSQRFHIRFLDDPGTWWDAILVASSSRATLLRLAEAWLLLTWIAPAVAYRDEDVARDAFQAVA